MHISEIITILLTEGIKLRLFSEGYENVDFHCRYTFVDKDIRY